MVAATNEAARRRSHAPGPDQEARTPWPSASLPASSPKPPDVAQRSGATRSTAAGCPRIHPLGNASLDEIERLELLYASHACSQGRRTEHERAAVALDDADRKVVVRAARRRASFLREEVMAGRIPAAHPLARAHLEEAERLDQLFPLPRSPQPERVLHRCVRRWRRRRGDSEETR